MSDSKSLFVQFIGEKAERPMCIDAQSWTKYLGSARELFSPADASVKWLKAG